MKGIFWGDCTHIFKNNGKDNRIDKLTIEECQSKDSEVEMVVKSLTPWFF